MSEVMRVELAPPVFSAVAHADKVLQGKPYHTPPAKIMFMHNKCRTLSQKPRFILRLLGAL